MIVPRHPSRHSLRATPLGQTMVEYAMLLAAIALTVYVGFQTMGQQVGSSMNIANSQINLGSTVTAGGGGSISPGGN
ncbi:MAG TPA: hypothetical protein VMV27_12160 [Candidatus Binataceae bacterium]|nr:hypothetical protein [Candidatus Binataceae bacterium]